MWILHVDESWSFHVNQIWLWFWTPSIRVWSMDNERFNDPTNGKWMVMQLDVVSKETMRYMAGTPEKYLSYSRRIPPIASSLTPSWSLPHCSNLKRRRKYIHDTDTKPVLISFHKRIWHKIFMQGQFDLPQPTYLPFFGWMIEANSTKIAKTTWWKTSMTLPPLWLLFCVTPFFPTSPNNPLWRSGFFQDKTPPSTWGYGKVVKKKITKHWTTSIWSIRISSCHHPTCWDRCQRRLRWVAEGVSVDLFGGFGNMEMGQNFN